MFRVVGYNFLISLFFGRGGGWGKVLRGDGGLKWMLYKIYSMNKLINTLNRPDTVYLDNILECTNGTSSTYVFPLPGNCTLLWVNISFPGLSHFHSIIAISWASCWFCATLLVEYFLSHQSCPRSQLGSNKQYLSAWDNCAKQHLLVQFSALCQLSLELLYERSSILPQGSQSSSKLLSLRQTNNNWI